MGKLPSSSPRTDTLAETGQLPISYHAVRARMNYHLLVKSRPDNNITTVALADAVAALQKQDNWWNLVQSDMAAWDMPDMTGTLSKCKQNNVKQIIAGRTKVACFTHWQTAVTGEEPHRPEWCTEATLAEHKTTHTLPLHLTDHRTTRWYKSQFCPKWPAPAPYLAARVHLPTTHLRALCSFRLGIAQLHAHTGAWKQPATPLLERTCKYCEAQCTRKVVEDPYHVCIECSLYERARIELYNRLLSLEFDFSSASTLADIYTALMTTSKPDTVRSVGRYLSDCMRDTYNGHTATSHWINKSNRIYARTCADKPLATCDQSLAILRRFGCDTTTCKQAAAHMSLTSKQT